MSSPPGGDNTNFESNEQVNNILINNVYEPLFIPGDCPLINNFNDGEKYISKPNKNNICTWKKINKKQNKNNKKQSINNKKHRKTLKNK